MFQSVVELKDLALHRGDVGLLEGHGLGLKARGTQPHSQKSMLSKLTTGRTFCDGEDTDFGGAEEGAPGVYLDAPVNGSE